MKTVLFLAVVAVACFSSVQCRDMVVGNSYNGRLLWSQKAEYKAIPFMKRVKEVFYTDPNQHIIKAVVAQDLKGSGAEASITSGGVGYSYVNIRMKSERGHGLHYELKVYV